MHKKNMFEALTGLSALVRSQFPAALKKALLEQSEELDRLRAEVNNLRSKIETKE
jgi:regulator of replication initiation timing